MNAATTNSRRAARGKLRECAGLGAFLAAAIVGCSGDNRPLSMTDGGTGNSGNTDDTPPPDTNLDASKGHESHADAATTMDASTTDASAGSGGRGGAGGRSSGGGTMATTGGSSGTSGTSGAANGGTPSGGSANGGTSSGGTSGAGGGMGGSTTCGNGHLDPGEECDDGNALDEDDCTSLCTDNKACEACLADQCDAPVTAAACHTFQDPAAQKACNAIYACGMRTECFLKAPVPPTDPGHSAIPGGGLACYCGPVETSACVDGNGTGACRAEVEAAFKAFPAAGGLHDPKAIVTNVGDPTLPGGAALAMLTCASRYCGTPGVIDGLDPPAALQCSPKQHAKAGAAGAGGSAGAGGGP
jgi:cysteine-rich repeat protein